MIQRVQSIYLLLAAILTGLTAILPIATINGTDGNSYITLTCLGIETNMQEFEGTHPWAITIPWILSVLLPIVAIFCFKNRRKQIRWVNYACSTNILLLLVATTKCWSWAEAANGTPRPEICALMPVIAVISTLLARRGISRDEALVRAADRIR